MKPKLEPHTSSDVNMLHFQARNMLLYLVGADSNGDAKIRNKIVAVASASVKRESVSVQCAGRRARGTGRSAQPRRSGARKVLRRQGGSATQHKCRERSAPTCLAQLLALTTGAGLLMAHEIKVCDTVTHIGWWHCMATSAEMVKTEVVG